MKAWSAAESGSGVAHPWGGCLNVLGRSTNILAHGACRAAAKLSGTVERLFEEIDRAEAHRFEGGTHAAVRGENDHRHPRPSGPCPAQQVHAMERSRHLQIEQHQVEVVLLQPRQRGNHVWRLGHPVAGVRQGIGHVRPDARLVVHDQDRCHNVIPGSSRIVVDLTGLRSDQDRRDGYLQRRLLETEQHPMVEFRPTALRGISLPLPASGSRTLEMSGNLTVKGVTRPTTWRVSTEFAGERITGRAATAFTFEDFQLTQPRVPVVLSVADTIHLEYDFNLVAGR